MVRVRSIGAPSWFKVFECGNAFNIILGKPWPKAVKAMHNYSTDKITITHNGETKTIPNSATQPSNKGQSVTVPQEITDNNNDTVVPETNPIEQLN